MSKSNVLSSECPRGDNVDYVAACLTDDRRTVRTFPDQLEGLGDV
jgi:hypothetical protein